MAGSKKKYALVLPCYSPSDPPTVNTIQNLVECGYDVVIFSSEHQFISADNIIAYTGKVSHFFHFNHIVHRVAVWINAFFLLKGILKKYNPAITVAFMHPQVAMIALFKKYRFIACIYDIPCLSLAGRIDRILIKAGIKNLHKAELVWCSDILKAELTKQDARLETLPAVCHNCPSVDYLKDKTQEDTSWLQNRMVEMGALKTEPLVILTRAGAIGINGGIEETIACMKNLPGNYVLLLMGRPTQAFKDLLNDIIKKDNLGNRVFVLENPDEELWKRVLLGSDIGHLIHMRPDNINDAINYDLNSSLSNNRLFQYMAASIPVMSYNDIRLNAIHEEVNCFRPVDIRADVSQSIGGIWAELGEKPMLRQALGANGRKAHLQKYNWEKQFSSVRNFIRNLN